MVRRRCGQRQLPDTSMHAQATRRSLTDNGAPDSGLVPWSGPVHSGQIVNI